MLRNSRMKARQPDPTCKFGHEASEARLLSYRRLPGSRDDEKVDTMALGIRAEWSTLQDLDEAGQLARLSLSNPDKVKITELLP